MFFKRVLPIIIIFLAGVFVLWNHQNSCVEIVNSTYQNGWQGVNQFSIKVERIPESCIFAAFAGGANYIFSVQQENSENWRQIMSVHNDDPIDIPKESIEILNEKVAYAFMNNKCAVTSDSGKTWSVWNVNKIPNWSFLDYGYIKEVTILESGIGLLKLNPLRKHNEIPEFYTDDFGKNWKQVK